MKNTIGITTFILFLFGSAILAAAFTGCTATEKWAEEIAVKNVSGNGTFFKSNIGIDPDSKIPSLTTTVVSGDLATSKAGSNSVTFREKYSGSIWNAKAVNKERFLSITMTDEGKVDDAIRAVSEVLRAALDDDKATDAEKEEEAAEDSSDDGDE